MFSRYLWLSNLLFIGICSYLAADSVNTIVAGKLQTMPTAEPVHDSGSFARNRRGANRDLQPLSNRNLLSAKREDLTPTPEVEESDQETEEKKSDGEIPSDDELHTCTLPGELIATIAAEDPSWSIAVYESKSEDSPEVYSIIEGKNALEDDALLLEIRPKAIIVHREDRFELCELGVEYDTKRHSSRRSSRRRRRHSRRSRNSSGLELGKSIEKVSDMNYEVDKEEVDKVLGNLSTVATQARIVPNFKHGKANGFKMFSIRPGSIYSKLGLKNGDVIQKINGYEMNSPDKALEIYQKLRNASSISVDLIRRGKPKSLSVSIR